MDLISQNKFKNVLIIVLLGVNLIAVSTLWIQASSRNDDQTSGEGKRPAQGESVELIKQVLDLNDAQVRQLDKLHSIGIDEAKKYNDSLDLLKKQLAEELFKEKPDSIAARIKSQQIGELQAKIELIRFRHFNDMLALCSAEQKEKLKPVISEVFGRRPPQTKPLLKKQNVTEKVVKPHDDTLRVTGRNSYEVIKQEDGLQQPPSIDEKLDKYSRRLNLTGEQKEKIRMVLQDQKQKNRMSRKRNNSEPGEFEIEKEKNRREEDDRIMQILDNEQKKEFSKMIDKRRMQSNEKR